MSKSIQRPGRIARIDRRIFLAGAGAFAATGTALTAWPRTVFGAGAPVTTGVPAGTADEAVLDTLPGKKPLIRLSERPQNYETPISYFDNPITPNDAFFVRYHLAVVPQVTAANWRLKVGGEVERPIEYDLAGLRSGFEQVELTAVCQCSGNRRGLSEPHVQGVQWGFGAMGNARWRGVRLKDVLAKAGVKAGSVEVSFDGADTAVIEKTPDFIKSLPLGKAIDENTLVAFEMNGEPLPSWNGFPARLVVPGWTGTYWIKHLTSIDVLAKPSTNFWMASAYRVPLGKFPMVDRFISQETAVNTPITEMVVNSIMTNASNGQRIAAGQPFTVRGIAWDGGYGIRLIEVSTDGGATWRNGTLGQDLGKFSFRPWTFTFTPAAGPTVVMAKATNAIGASQTFELNYNAPGYHNNVVHKVSMVAA